MVHNRVGRGTNTFVQGTLVVILLLKQLLFDFVCKLGCVDWRTLHFERSLLGQHDLLSLNSSLINFVKITAKAIQLVSHIFRFLSVKRTLILKLLNLLICIIGLPFCLHKLQLQLRIQITHVRGLLELFFARLDENSLVFKFFIFLSIQQL